MNVPITACCNRCGSMNSAMSRLDSVGAPPKFWVTCQACGATGGTYPSEELAAARWNQPPRVNSNYTIWSEMSDEARDLSPVLGTDGESAVVMEWRPDLGDWVAFTSFSVERFFPIGWQKFPHPEMPPKGSPP